MSPLSYAGTVTILYNIEPSLLREHQTNKGAPMHRLTLSLIISTLGLFGLPAQASPLDQASEASPLDGPYTLFMEFCASSVVASKACGVYYQGLFDSFRRQEEAGDLDCIRAFDSVRYIEVHTDYLASGRGEILKPEEFVTAVYRTARDCQTGLGRTIRAH